MRGRGKTTSQGESTPGTQKQMDGLDNTKSPTYRNGTRTRKNPKKREINDGKEDTNCARGEVQTTSNFRQNIGAKKYKKKQITHHL